MEQRKGGQSRLARKAQNLVSGGVQSRLLPSFLRARSSSSVSAENVDIPQFTISEAAQRDARLAQKELLEKADEEWIALRQARREAKRQQRNARHELDRGRRRSVGEGMARTAHLQNEMGRITALQATGQLE